MGSTFTAQPDRAAVRQAGRRALSLYEADDAFSERLGRLITMVRRLRIALHRHHGEETSALYIPERTTDGGPRPVILQPYMMTLVKPKPNALNYSRQWAK